MIIDFFDFEAFYKLFYLYLFIINLNKNKESKN